MHMDVIDAARDTACDGGVRQVALSELQPAPENDQLYRPVSASDPEVRALAISIREHGVKEPLVLSLDGFILSGHRRYVAAHLAGLKAVPCRIESVRRDDDIDRFVKLLREFNRQRVKSVDEMLREEVVSADPEEAYQTLIEHRSKNPDMSEFSGEMLELSGRRRRNGISRAKHPMLAAIRKVIEQRRDFWPLSDRQVHYALLNDPPLRHASKPNSRYANDRRSYQDLTDLLTRARLDGLVPWQAIEDETRPFVSSRSFPNPQPYIREEIDYFLRWYRRDLMQSQPDHIEVVAEKLTVRSIVEPVVDRYCIPLTIGRGFCSLAPRQKMAVRHQRSGKDRLVILILSDFDPEGETIAESFARSMRDDFGIEDVVPIKVALNSQQVREFNLPPQMKAKTGSATYRHFVDRHGDDVYELEALPPAELQRLLGETIDSVIDTELFNTELDRERQDAGSLETARRRVQRALADLNGQGG